MSGKVVKRGRRCGGPLERSAFPRIHGSDRAAEAAPDKVEKEDELSGASEQGVDGDEFVDGNERRQIVVHKSGVAANVANQTKVMHGHKNAVHAEEGEPEMPFAERFVHHPAEHFGKPEVSPGEDPEKRGHGHNKMEMGDNEVGGVQIGVERRLRQIEPANTTADE